MDSVCPPIQVHLAVDSFHFVSIWQSILCCDVNLCLLFELLYCVSDVSLFLVIIVANCSLCLYDIAFSFLGVSKFVI